MRLCGTGAAGRKRAAFAGPVSCATDKAQIRLVAAAIDTIGRGNARRLSALTQWPHRLVFTASDRQEMKDFIGYQALTDAALRGVVREALRRVEKQGLIGAH